MKRITTLLVLALVFFSCRNQEVCVLSPRYETFSVVNALETRVDILSFIKGDSCLVSIPSMEEYAYWVETEDGHVEDGKWPVAESDTARIQLADKAITIYHIRLLPVNESDESFQSLWEQGEDKTIRLVIDESFVKRLTRR